MANFPVDIVINTPGANALGPLNRQLNETDSAATGAASASRALGAAIAAVASSATLGQIVRLSDSYTKVQNSIVNVVSSTTELTERTSELLRVANQSRSSFEATAGLYGKLKRATDDLGISQERVLRITDSINKGFIASGATTTEASNAITQLAQGLASGALRGDEFNSVAEQAPVILRAVAQETGKTIGQLREFAATGGITADILIRAIEGYADTIDREFARTAVTFEQQQTVAANLATEWVGSSDAIRSASQAAGSALVTVAQNLDVVATAAGVVAAVYGARLVGSLAAGTVALATQAAAATRTAVTYDALGVAVARTTALQTAGVAASRAATVALAAIGGPVGAAVLAASALIYFGSSAADAADETRKSKLAEEVQKLTDKYEGLSRLSQRGIVEGLTQQQIELNEQLIIANKALDEAQRKADAAPRSSGQSFTGVNVGASVADAELSAATARVRELQSALSDTQAKLEGLLNSRSPDENSWVSPKKTEATLTFYDELKLKLEQQIATIGLTEVEQARLQARQELLNKATKEGVTLTEAQITAYSDLAAQAVIQQQRAEADAYILTLGRQVAAERDIGVQAEINANLARLSASATAEQRLQVEALTQSLYAQREAQQADIERNEIRAIGVAEESPSEKLQRELQEKQDLLFNAYYEELIGQEEYEQRRLNLEKEYAGKRKAAVAANDSAIRQATAQGLDALAGIIEAGGGKSTKAYRAVFAASRAFALADSIAKIAQAQAQALADPTAVTLPQKIANYAAVFSAGASLLTSLKSPANFADGGYVSGAGTGRSDSIPAFLSNGEFVMPAQRTDQYRSELDAMRRGTFGAAPVSASRSPITIINNVADVAAVEVSEGPDGELIATIDRRIAEQTPSIIAQELGDPYSQANKSLNAGYRLERN